ncbi:uncharacterized protein LOC113338488 [Papaver somniferum]|uniref:uncharacterized protein LOC113338488 n=1 Tax=Papaver somniferum TaxID=3469 RepID=UPI000E6FA8D3|nr:uncharacterized protein LOC113338488 [Papaver somniferum]
MVSSDNAWNFNFARTLNEMELGDITEMLQGLGEVSNLFDSALEDTRLWRFGDDFTVENCYASLDIGGLLAFPHKQVWNPKVPLKVSFLIWSICHDGAPTLDMLLRAGLVQNDICLLCDTEQETQSHLFLHCYETRKLWHYFLDSFKLLWVFSDSVKRNVRECLILSVEVSRENFGVFFRLLYGGPSGMSATTDYIGIKEGILTS